MHPAPSHVNAAARAARLRELGELGWAFLKLGCSSFGGPIAHLGYLRAEFVARRKWLSDAEFGDLVALCQFLPGPASSQVVFGLGMQRAGLLGALAASICFTLPSALLMIAFAYGVAGMAAAQYAAWLHGLQLAAVPVVAQAVWAMAKQLCTDATRAAICIASAAALLALPSALTQLGVIAGAALVGWRWCRGEAAEGAKPAASVESPTSRNRIYAGTALSVFVALLALLPALTAATGNKQIALFDGFYRAGALVFGGGHVVMPLLRAQTAAHGWLSDDQFIAGYGAAQALPGPLFAFAAYVGTAMSAGTAGWRTGLWALLAIYLPSWLLVGGAWPFWQQLRSQRAVRAALAGANAAVVGVLLAALCTPLIAESVRSPKDAAVALVAFGALQYAKAPPWLIVGALACAGQWVLR